MILKPVGQLLIVLCGFAIFNSSCKFSKSDDRPLPADSAYFSIKEFVKDQIILNSGQPISLTRISVLNGEKDSSLTNYMTANWAPVFDAFNESDIAARKFLGQYSFSQFDDESTGTHDFVYTAKNPKLFTRTLQIHIDPYTNKIKSIYIETAKNNFWTNTNKKLLFIPYRIIQIQEAEHYFIGKSKELLVEFQFPQTESNVEE